MTYNIMAEYTEHTRKFLRTFMQEFFKEQYDKDITNEYIETYVEARYNNYGGNENQRVFYRRIYSALKKSEEKLIYNQYEENHKMIKDMLELYQYIFYIEPVA